jgi:hypothetical protein
MIVSPGSNVTRFMALIMISKSFSSSCVKRKHLDAALWI